MAHPNPDFQRLIGAGTQVFAANESADTYTRSSPFCESERIRMDRQFQWSTALPLQLAISAANSRERLTVVDFGSGYGAIVDALVERGVNAKLRLVDVNPRLLAFAGARAAKAGFIVETRVGALDGEDAHEGDADVALVSFVLTHCQSLELAVRNAARAVHIGGLVVLVDVDYVASIADNDHAAAMTLECLQERLAIKGFVSRIDRIATTHGLRPLGAFACHSWLEVTTANWEVKDEALGFVKNFDSTDLAHQWWTQIGADAHMVTHRMRRIYRRTQ